MAAPFLIDSAGLFSAHAGASCSHVARIAVGVLRETGHVLVEDRDALGRTHDSLLDFRANEFAHAPMQVVWKVLHLREHVLDRRAGNDLLDPEIVRFLRIGINVRFGHAPEQIVGIADDVLVGAHEKKREVVGLAGVRRVQRQIAVVGMRRNVVADPAVGIAGQVDEHAAPVRPLVEAVDRHDRKRLADRPVIEHRLKDREIAEVEVRELTLELGDLGNGNSREAPERREQL